MAPLAGRVRRAASPLLAAGGSAHALDAQRSTPLHYAALLGEGALAAMLLEAGGDAAACDEDGRTPAELAAAEGHTELAGKLAV